MNENEMREIFREMREEPIPADSLARVRMGVDRRRRQVAPRKLLAILAVAACLVAGWLFTPRKTVQHISAPVIAQVMPPVEIPAPPEIPVRRAPRSKRALPRPRPVEGVPVSIRIETPDPDIVILLVN